MQRLSLFSLGTVNAKTGYNKPKTEKHYQTEQKHKSQNRNKHPKAETHTKKTKLNHKTKREFKNTNHDQKPQNRNKVIMQNNSFS